jgi:hypothetical protein
MELKNLKFTFEDFIKAAGFLVVFMSGYYNLVSEIKENKIVNNADKVIINFRLATVENLLNVKPLPSQSAILPQQPNVPKKEDE